MKVKTQIFISCERKNEPGAYIHIRPEHIAVIETHFDRENEYEEYSEIELVTGTRYQVSATVGEIEDRIFNLEEEVSK